MEPEGSLPRLHVSLLGRTNGSVQARDMYPFRNKASIYGEELLAPRQSPVCKITPCRLSVTADSI
jgi:hypothetical protein